MDPDVEPCDDFYNYACGKFVKETVIPDEKVSVNTFSVIGDRLQQQLRALVSDEISESEATPFKLAKNLYKLCMNKSMSEAVRLRHNAPSFDRRLTTRSHFRHPQLGSRRRASNRSWIFWIDWVDGLF